MAEVVGQSRLMAPPGEAVRLPVAHMVCNQIPPIGDKPSLMTFREVETLFHETGHALQHMLTEVSCTRLAIGWHISAYQRCLSSALFAFSAVFSSAAFFSACLSSASVLLSAVFFSAVILTMACHPRGRASRRTRR